MDLALQSVNVSACSALGVLPAMTAPTKHSGALDRASALLFVRPGLYHVSKSNSARVSHQRANL